MIIQEKSAASLGDGPKPKGALGVVTNVIKALALRKDLKVIAAEPFARAVQKHMRDGEVRETVQCSKPRQTYFGEFRIPLRSMPPHAPGRKQSILYNPGPEIPLRPENLSFTADGFIMSRPVDLRIYQWGEGDAGISLHHPDLPRSQCPVTLRDCLALVNQGIDAHKIRSAIGAKGSEWGVLHRDWRPE